MKTKIQINSVETVNGQIQVTGTVDPTGAPVDFVATTFRWGSKMLMKVDDNLMDRGLRIAVGHAAKKAIRSLGLEIPKAELKRPRKAKVEEAPPKEDFSGKTVKELKDLCRQRGIKGHSRDGVTKTDLIGLLGG